MNDRDKLLALLGKMAEQAELMAVAAAAAAEAMATIEKAAKKLGAYDSQADEIYLPLGEYSNALATPYTDDLGQASEFRKVAREAERLAKAAKAVNTKRLLRWASLEPDEDGEELQANTDPELAALEREDE